MTENREPGLAPAAKAIEDLEKKLRTGIQKQVLMEQNLARHQAVLGFLKIQILVSRREGETREQMALYVARLHSRGLYSYLQSLTTTRYSFSSNSPSFWVPIRAILGWRLLPKVASLQPTIRSQPQPGKLVGFYFIFLYGY